MSATVRDLRHALERRRGERDRVTADLAAARRAAKRLAAEGRRAADAQAFLQVVAQQTQEALEYQVGELVSLALGAVFGGGWRFRVAFELKRGRTEASLSLEDADGHQVDPMTADGGGDYRMCALAYGSGNKIHEIEYGWGHEHKKMQLNIGSVWASLGEYNFGMKRLEGAGKLMGLASYGSVQDEIVEALNRQMLYHPFAAFPSHEFGSRNGLMLNPTEIFAQDVCTSLQQVTTEFYLQAAERLKARKPLSHRLIMTGGCSMNCIANTAIHQSELYEDTWVPAQPHDGGLSLGQALFVWHHVLDQPRNPVALTPYLGTDAGQVDEDLIPAIIDLLEQGNSVGLCYGRAESGPRALGHRSILLDPRLADGKDRLNEKVKHREWYRPFAPMVLGDWGVPSKYMSYIVPTDAAEVPAVTHVDGTSRPQIVEPGDDPFVVKLLTAWHAKTGCNVLLNTSFNCREPLVDTVDQARATWHRTGLDVLVSPQGIETEKAKASLALNPSEVDN